MRWLLRVLLLPLLLGSFLTAALPASGALDSTISVAAKPNVGGLRITNLTLTDLGSSTVQVDYVLSGNTTYAMVVVNRSHMPTLPTDGEEAYYGTSNSVNLTGLNLDYSTYYVAVFPYASDNATRGDPATGSIGGTSLITLIVGIIALTLTGLAFGLRLGTNDRNLWKVTFLHFLAFAAWMIEAVVLYSSLPTTVSTYLPTAGALLCVLVSIVHAAMTVMTWLSRYSTPSYEDERKEIMDRLRKYLPERKKWWEE